MRLANLTTMIFISMSFSTGLPVYYAICTLSMILSYLIDKLLLLRFYRMNPMFDRYISELVIQMLPYSLLLHCIFGILIISTPNYLSSQNVLPEFGFSIPYFSRERIG